MLPIQLSFQEAITFLEPLILFIIGMAVYAIFIFHFYKFIAKRDFVDLDLNQYNDSKHPLFNKLNEVLFYIIEYIFLVPLFTFIWFVVLLGLLTFLSEQLMVQHLILTSMAVVGAIRITSYYNEDLSSDLAKLLPLALLGVYIVDSKFISLSESWNTLMQVPSEWKMLMYYLLFAIGLEFVMRILHLVIDGFSDEKAE